jgi:hypothetical protein
MAFVAPYAEQFETAVHGTVFGSRAAVVNRLHAGDPLILVPDPPGAEVPAVWVHAPGGDVVGHLPVHIAAWMAPWMLQGARCRASVASVASDDVASWQRLVIEVRCRGGDAGTRDEERGE